ncbi:MAG TPA: hypothetical protein VFA30_10280 [Gaiellaceae bacterium]|nr:hypothetical protein [Gaiellaceae bacterium]
MADTFESLRTVVEELRAETALRRRGTLHAVVVPADPDPLEGFWKGLAALEDGLERAGMRPRPPLTLIEGGRDG